MTQKFCNAVDFKYKQSNGEINGHSKADGTQPNILPGMEKKTEKIEREKWSSRVHEREGGEVEEVANQHSTLILKAVAIQIIFGTNVSE